MKKILLALLAVLALTASACGASGGTGGKEEGEGNQNGGKKVEQAADSSFGDLTELCGDGDFTVKADEAGKGTDKLYLAVANDRSANFKPGLNKVLYDASVAFSDWCNEQGGIGGLQIEIIDADAGVFNVEPAMTAACNDAFAMVGGGHVQDALQFSGKEGSDFHKCGMVDIPAFAVSGEKSDSNGQIQPIPNPATSVGTGFMQKFKDLFPEAAESWGMIRAEVPSLILQKNKYVAAAESVGMSLDGDVAFPPIAVTDFTPFAQKFLEFDDNSFTYMGEVEYMGILMKSLRQQGWEGIPIVETNMYDPILAAEPGAEGTVVRMTYHPFEEKDMWPATAKYLEINKKYVPDGIVGGLGIQSTSAWLLFVTAANACGEKNGGELTRTCILEEAAAVDDWTGGGLHGPQNPEPAKTAKASACSMLLEVKGGKFIRLHPKLDSKDDNGAGFYCPEGSVIDVPENKGVGKVDPDRPI